MAHCRLRILHAAQLVQVAAGGERLLRGAAMNEVAVVADGGIVVGGDGTILLLGPSDEVAAASDGYTFDADVDATGKCVLPGFVDCHTHPVWAGNRSWELREKLAGATYMDIAARGGGIGLSARCTREATEDELLGLLRRRLRRMARQGTTTLEAKSGYGLETATELKMLRVIRRAELEGPLDIVATFLGAHAVPAGVTSEAATDAVVVEMLPALAARQAAGDVNVSNVDVFCETGVFSRDQARRIIRAGQAQGLEANFHGDELSPMGAGELAGETGALAVSHLEHISKGGIAAMALRPSFAVLLPSTAYVLRIPPPPARDIIDGGVPVALGSDFCPNAHSLSMPFTMNLACVLLHMTAEEALVAATLNAAASVQRSDVCGSLEVGKLGDIVLLDAPFWVHVVYEMADPPIEAVYKRGVLL